MTLENRYLKALMNDDYELIADLNWSFCNKIVHQKSKDTVLHILCRHGANKTLNMFYKKYEEDLIRKKELVKTKSYNKESEMYFNLNIPNFEGKTPLHEAAQNGYNCLVSFLLDHGADINAIKRGDWTPLMCALTKKHLHVVENLIKNGADISIYNKDGWNCMHIAAREGDLALECLLESSNKIVLREKLKDLVKSLTKNGRTPLHIACLHGQLRSVEILLQEGADVNVKDSCGSTPLMDAVRSGNKNIEKLLLDKGANPNEKDKLKKSLYDIKKEMGYL